MASPRQPLKVALIHQIDAKRARNSWSASMRFTAETIARHIGPVTDVGPAPINLLPYRIARKLLAFFGRNYSFEHDLSLARRYGAYFSRALAEGEYDLVYAPAGSAVLAFLETNLPIIYYSDATWRVMRNYYSYYSNVIPRTAHGAEELERRALERATIVVMPSHWAASSAIDDYGADPAKVYALGLGANLLEPPAREAVLPKRPGGTIRLLMVGVSWEIKGGEIARETLIELLRLGLDAELTVVGCAAPPGMEHPRMRVFPYLNKYIPEERRTLERLWREADFFLLPTRFEAAGVVFAEASAHALPSIATRTGGVPSLVVDGINGYTLPHEARGDRYAQVIAELAADPERYQALCRSARMEYETRLNWDAWGRGVARAVAEHLPGLRDRLPDIA